MASYEELRSLHNDAPLKNKVATAITIAAQNIIGDQAPTTARKAWAAKAFANPEGEAKRVMMSVLAANKDITVAAIKAASDGAIQANVDAAIALFIDADAGA